jgi:hypothetical protein
LEKAEVDEDFRAVAEQELEGEECEGKEHETGFMMGSPAGAPHGHEGIEDERNPAEDEEDGTEGVIDEGGFGVEQFDGEDEECAEVDELLPSAEVVVHEGGVEAEVEDGEGGVQQCLGELDEVAGDGDEVEGGVEGCLEDLLECEESDPEVVALGGLGAEEHEGEDADEDLKQKQGPIGAIVAEDVAFAILLEFVMAAEGELAGAEQGLVKRGGIAQQDATEGEHNVGWKARGCGEIVDA